MISRSVLVIVFISLFVRKSLAQHPSVPCPHIFQYARSNNKNIGLITINKVNYGDTVVEIELSQSGSINSEYVGGLNLNFDKEKIFDYIKSGSAVTYKVDFALENVIPQVTAIRLNGAQICSGPEVSAPSTKVIIKHSLTAPGSPSDTPQETQPRDWTTSRLSTSLPWEKLTSNPRQNLNFGYPNFLSSNYLRPQQQLSKETSNPFSNGPNFGYPKFLSGFNKPNNTFNKDTSNPFFNGKNEFYINFTIPTSSTTERPVYNGRNPPAFLNAFSYSTTTTPVPTTTSTTTTTTTTTTTPRPFIHFAPDTISRSNIVPESGPSSHFMQRPSEWTYIDSVCGQENLSFTPKKLAVNGQRIPRARFPWIVALFQKNIGTLTFQCGGSLITTRTVITAAHCFYSGFDIIKDEDILVSMGRHNLTDWSDSYIIHRDVERIIRHPDYRPELVNIDADLAIMQLKTSVTFSFAIRPICTWQGRLDVNVIEGISGIVVGWGRDENNNNLTTSPRLVSAKIASEVTCIRSNQKLFYLTSNRTLCAGNRDGSGPCNGDSGSGLMIRIKNKWMLRGTVSASLSNDINSCDLEEYVVYTDIAQFLGWIYANSVF